MAEETDKAAEDNALIDAMRALSVDPADKEEMTERMKVLREGVMSPDPAVQLAATTKLRKLLSIERTPPVEEVVEAGIVPRIVSFLAPAQSKELRFEAAWAVTNVASSTTAHTQLVVECGAVALFVTMLSADSEELVEQAMWGLGNIAGDSFRLRNFVLRAGALGAILPLVTPASRITLLRNAAWTISNLCRGKPSPSLDEVRPAIQTLAKLLHARDEEVLSDVLWALSYITDGQNERIGAVLEDAPGIATRLIELLAHKSDNVKTPCLRTVGNCVTGDDHQTQEFVNRGVLPSLQALLSNPKKSIRKEAAWAVSNIAAGSQAQIGAVLAVPGLVPDLIAMLKNESFDVQKEVCWAISNLTSGGSKAQIRKAFEFGSLPALIPLLTSSDARIVDVSLTAIENILSAMIQADGSPNPAVTALEECEGVESIEQLQHNASEEIYTRALAILEKFFQVEPAGEIEPGAE